MPLRVIVHIHGEESVLGEIESVPKPTDNFMVVFNPRRRDGKPLPTVDENAQSLLFPWSRIAFVELFEERSTQRESVVGFFREGDNRFRAG